MGIATRDEITW